ncbi:hypothetical protein D9M68_553050 [compost metagenome]
MFTHRQGASLIRQKALREQLGLSHSGFYKLRQRDSSFPKPIKNGDSRQAAVFYVAAEVEAWLQSKIQARDAA